MKKWECGMFLALLSVLFLAGCTNGGTVSDNAATTPLPNPATVSVPPPAPSPPAAQPLSSEDIRIQQLIAETPSVEAYMKFHESISGEFKTLKPLRDLDSPNDVTRNRAIIEGMQSRHFANMEVPTIFATSDSLLASGLSKMKVGHVQMEMGLSMNDKDTFEKGAAEATDGSRLIADAILEAGKQAGIRADEMDAIDAKRSGKRNSQ